MQFYCPSCRKHFTADEKDIRTEFYGTTANKWTKCTCGVHCDRSMRISKNAHSYIPAKTKVGEILDALREESGEVFAIMAKRIGTNPTIIYRIRTGERFPSIEWLNKLADEYDLGEEDRSELLMAREEDRLYFQKKEK